jgi:hypothetical protein
LIKTTQEGLVIGTLISDILCRICYVFTKRKLHAAGIEAITGTV